MYESRKSRNIRHWYWASILWGYRSQVRGVTASLPSLLAPVMYPGEPAATQELPVRLMLYAYYMSGLGALSQLKDNLQTVRSIAGQRTYHCFLGGGLGHPPSEAFPTYISPPWIIEPIEGPQSALWEVISPLRTLTVNVCVAGPGPTDGITQSGPFTRLYTVTLSNAVAEVRRAGGRVRRIAPVLVVDRR